MQTKISLTSIPLIRPSTTTPTAISTIGMTKPKSKTAGYLVCQTMTKTTHSSAPICLAGSRTSSRFTNLTASVSTQFPKCPKTSGPSTTRQQVSSRWESASMETLPSLLDTRALLHLCLTIPCSSKFKTFGLENTQCLKSESFMQLKTNTSKMSTSSVHSWTTTIMQDS